MCFYYKTAFSISQLRINALYMLINVFNHIIVIIVINMFRKKKTVSCIIWVFFFCKMVTVINISKFMYFSDIAVIIIVFGVMFNISDKSSIQSQ